MYKMIEPEQALELVLENCPLPELKRIPATDSENLILAESVCADRDYPSFNRSMMDGFAVKAADGGKVVVCRGIVAAGHENDLEVEDGYCLEIMTGAACPESADIVVPVENVQIDGDKVTLPENTKSGKNIAPRGIECSAGQEVASKGDLISPLVIANLACFGLSEVAVYQKPEIVLISTGDELAGPGAEISSVQIRDSNGPMLQAMSRENGIFSIGRLHAEDNLDSLATTISEAEKYDIVIFSGGVSMGKYDLVPEALQKAGADLIFHKSKQKPGKPLLFARKGRQLFFGLPGNPLAAHMCFHRYIVPVIRKMTGKEYVSKKLNGSLTCDVSKKGNRTFFQLVKVEKMAEGQYQLTPLRGKGSADIHSAARADAYIIITNDKPSLKKNDIVEFEFTGEARWLI